MWLGPARWAPYSTLRCTRQWTLISDYSIGCLGGAWGIHHVDIAQWALDADASGPIAVEGRGTIPAEGLFDTFQTFEVEHTYAGGVRLLHLDHRTARRRFPPFDVEASMGILFEGTGGWIYVARGFLDAQPRSILRSIVGPNETKLPVSADHRRDFLDAVRHGTEPICPVGPGVKSEIVCQQAEIALRIGQRLEWDNEREQFIDHAVANRMLSRPMRQPWRL
jgi:predicted dehydrogenase